MEVSPTKFNIKGTKDYIRCVYTEGWSYMFHSEHVSFAIDEGTFNCFVSYELIPMYAKEYLNIASQGYKAQL